MKRSGFFIVSLFLLLVLCSGFVMADEYAIQFQSRVLESWDEESVTDHPRSRDWLVRGSKFRHIEKDKDGNVVAVFPKQTLAPAYPKAMFGYDTDHEGLRSLGIHGKFDRRAYNYIELIPVKFAEGSGPDSMNPEWEENPIPIPGRAKVLDMWVWGSNYRFSMEVHIRDFRGIVHVLHFGSLAYHGWKNLFANIPTNIPQANKYSPSAQALEVIKVVVRTDPREKVDDFYIYFDHFKVLTDMHENPYDGSELSRPKMLDEIWGNSEDKKSDSSAAPSEGK